MSLALSYEIIFGYLGFLWMKCSWKKQDVTTYAKNDFQLNFRHNSCITSKILTKVLFMMSQYYDLRHLMTHITDHYNMGHMIHYLFVIIDNARFIFDSYIRLALIWQFLYQIVFIPVFIFKRLIQTMSEEKIDIHNRDFFRSIQRIGTWWQ